VTGLLERAIAAHYRCGADGEPRMYHCKVWDQKLGFHPVRIRTYITLSDGTSLLAVYRVRKCGRLARLKRGPSYLKLEALRLKQLANNLLVIREAKRRVQSWRKFEDFDGPFDTARSYQSLSMSG